MAFGFLTNKEAQEKIEGLEARVTELEAEVQTKDSELSQTQADLATANENLTAAEGRIDELRLEAAKVGPLEEKVTKLEADVQEAEQSAETKAQRLLAATGHTQVQTDGNDGGEASKTPHLDKINALSGEARSAYYRENEAAIKAEMSA